MRRRRPTFQQWCFKQPSTPCTTAITAVISPIKSLRALKKVWYLTGQPLVPHVSAFGEPQRLWLAYSEEVLPPKRLRSKAPKAQPVKDGWRHNVDAEHVLQRATEGGAFPGMCYENRRRWHMDNITKLATLQRRARELLAEQFGDVEIVFGVDSAGAMSLKFAVLERVP